MSIDEKILKQRQQSIINIAKDYKTSIVVDETGLDEGKLWRILANKVDNPSWIDFEKIRLFVESKKSE